MGLTAKEVRSEKLTSENIAGEYTLIIEGFDWGPAVNKVVLSAEGPISEVNLKDFEVAVKRSSTLVEMQGAEAAGNRTVLYAYPSNEKGNRLPEGNYITLVLLVGPDHVLGSPIKYIRQERRSANRWIDYKMTVTNTATNTVWDTEKARIRPVLDDFDLTGTFSEAGITMSYASYEPKTAGEKFPLIIWLHGGGEGGTDASIPLVANRATHYASDEIQDIMGGAYVLSPQSPTFWMESANGKYTRGDTNDIYNGALLALIKKYVAAHPKIDANRIYVGGCSNGGYMSLKLVLEHPDYFAAAFISALAYQAQYISDAQLQSIKNVPIWFVHSKDDGTTIPEETVLPLYNRLKKAGATNVHLSFYDHVVDLNGMYGGDDYRFNGHWSWIYCHANKADFDFDGNPVLHNGKAVTIMEWMAGQHN
tara:strand:+ start:650 stop:1912 length:1263 start_codon:yes stop_codon:yes gene_type:complete